MGFQSSITGAGDSIARTAVMSSLLKDQKTSEKYENIGKEAYGEFMKGLTPSQRENLMQKQDEARDIVEQKIAAMKFQATAVNAHLRKLRGEEKKAFDTIGHEQKDINLSEMKSELQKLV